MAIELTLLSRSYCHLCHDMEVALQPLLAEFGAGLTVLDVDADPVLEARYDELVPVLPDWMDEAPVPVYAVMLQERHRLPKIRACIDHWAEWLAAR